MDFPVLLLYNAALVALTIGGGLPVLLRRGAGSGAAGTNLVLAASGAFLLGVTLLHLLPESFAEEGAGTRVGGLLLAGFFVQLIVQRATHGIEHGHAHPPAPGTGLPLASMVAGLGLHALMEGIPLGFNYRAAATGPSLFLAVAAHKVPEALVLTAVAAATVGKKKALAILTGFALLTPLGGAAATWLGQHYGAVARLREAAIPVVGGAFLQISTTIFFESGTRQHAVSARKIGAILAGVGAALATLLLE